jgi:hypothetical protein
MLMKWSSAFLYNRLLWIAVGVCALMTTYLLFPISVEVLTSRGSRRKLAKLALVEDIGAISRPQLVFRKPSSRSLSPILCLIPRALGFIQRKEKPDDIDMVFYITAHELAHQWWGHQLVGSETQGPT